MLPDHVRDVADQHWARDFGCSPSQLRPARTLVQAHAGELVGYPGIWILVVGGAPLISVPPALFHSIRERAATVTAELVLNTAALCACLGPLPVQAVIGPAFIGYGTAETLDLGRASDARELTADDRAAIDELRAATEDDAWEHGGSVFGEVPTFGAFDGSGRLIALAGYETWSDTLAHLATVTAPTSRGLGYATAAVACAARHALDAGLVPQYRTLLHNAPSMRIAQRLGFPSYGFSTALRLSRCGAAVSVL